MRILDVNDNELQEEDVDLEEGYLADDKIFKVHHDEIPAVEQQWHYGVLEMFFEDGGKYVPLAENDPHVIVPQDPHSTQFIYRETPTSEPRKIRGMSLEQIIDVKGVDAIAAWDEYEDIKRYILYSEEEKATRAETQRLEREKENLLTTGFKRLNDLEVKTQQHDSDLANQALAETEDFHVISIGLEHNSLDLQEVSETVDDLILTMADVLGGEI